MQFAISGGISMRRVRIGMARINATMGDFVGNTRKIL